MTGDNLLPELTDGRPDPSTTFVGPPASGGAGSVRGRLAELVRMAAGRRLDYAKMKRNDVKRREDARREAESWRDRRAVGVFRAEYPGWCPKCRKAITRNDPICRDYDLGKYVHYDCDQPRGLKPS